MARLFGQNDIQSLLQHLNKYSVSNIKSIGQTSVATASIVNADIDTKDKAKVSNKRSHDERVAVELSKSDRKRLKKQHKQEALQQLEQTKLAKEEGEETKTMLATPSDDNTEVIITARNERSQKLRNSSLERLMEAQFRSMNEYLYSNSSMMALSYMDKNLFEKYHQAYRKIVERWPVKPLGMYRLIQLDVGELFEEQ